MGYFDGTYFNASYFDVGGSSSLPTVSTVGYSNLTPTSVVASGYVSSDGGSAVIQRGICIGTTPAVDYGTGHVIMGSGLGAFSGTITDLPPNTLLYIRAYASNANGIGYGSVISFTTPAAASAPTVTSGAVTGIGTITATGNGNVTSDGGSPILERGVCWKTSTGPTTSDSKAIAAGTTGAFTAALTGLAPNTTYHTKAYARNAVGTSYGAEQDFTTNANPNSAPTVTTVAPSAIGSTFASSGGNVTSDGGSPVLSRGVCYNTTGTPTTADPKVDGGSGSGYWTSFITGLLPGTLYYVRAYATNGVGTSYGAEYTFTTSGVTPPPPEPPPNLGVTVPECPDKYDLLVTLGSESHGLICDWTKDGVGLRIPESSDVTKSTAVSTKGDYGVRDVTDYWRIVQSDWSEGAGQPTFDREKDSENAYWDSKNIDVSTVGSFRLGPATITSGDATVLPVIVAALADGSGNPYVFCASSASPYLKYSTDGRTWTSVTGTVGAAPTALCTDGQYVYAVCNGVVYRGTTSGWANYSTDGSNANIKHIAFASGTLYATKGDASTTAQIGAFATGANPAWTALSPTLGKNINASGVSFGLVAVGNYVYWGVTNGMVTKLYKALLGGGAVADVIQEVTVFPTGMVGHCMINYGKTIYVGGHFDGRTVNTGIGTIYAVENDTPALLTDIGDDRTEDNRVLSLACYERSLYFISASYVWRWDLVHGGYSSYAGPLNTTPTIVYGTIAWDGIWDMSVEPSDSSSPYANRTVTPDTTGTITSGELVMFFDANATMRWYSSQAQATLNDLTGITLEVDTPADFISNDSLTFHFGIEGSLREVNVTIRLQGAAHTGILKSGAYEIATFSTDSLTAATWRLTLKDNLVKLFRNGLLIASGAATQTTTDKQLFFGGQRGSPGQDGSIKIGEVRWYLNGDYDPSISTQTLLSGGAIVCARDAVWAACTSYGTVKTDPWNYFMAAANAMSAYLTSSETSGSMPTVDKFFSTINAQLDGVLPTGTSILVTALIDGVFVSALENTSLSSATLKVFTLGMKGRSIRYAICLATSDGFLTPVVTEVAVLFKPIPKTAKTYTYFIRCWDSQESRLTGQDWDDDAVTVADFLERIASELVSVSRPGRGGYIGRVGNVEYLEAPPSTRANGREGLYRVEIEQVSQ